MAKIPKSPYTRVSAGQYRDNRTGKIVQSPTQSVYRPNGPTTGGDSPVNQPTNPDQKGAGNNPWQMPEGLSDRQKAALQDRLNREGAAGAKALAGQWRKQGLLNQGGNTQNPNSWVPDWIKTDLVGKNYNDWIKTDPTYAAEQADLNKQMSWRMAGRGLLGSGAEQAATTQANVDLNKKYQDQFANQQQQQVNNLSGYLSNPMGWNNQQQSTAAGLFSNLANIAASQKPGEVPGAINSYLSQLGVGSGGASGPNYSGSNAAKLGFGIKNNQGWWNSLFNGLGFNFNLNNSNK